MVTRHDAALLAEIATHLREGHDDAPLTARRIVASALEVVADADYASVTVRHRKDRFETLASTDEVAAQLDKQQYALREGPCVDTIEAADFFRSGDIEHDERWPSWGPRAAAMGVGSMLSVQLLKDGLPIGALNLYSRQNGAFADRDMVDLATLYATHAALALTAAEELSGLQTAMTSRHTIGMAQGIFMERFGLTPEQAFALLQRMSSTGNLKLRDVAAQVVHERNAV
jgi:GAF domain-containing protein